MEGKDKETWHLKHDDVLNGLYSENTYYNKDNDKKVLRNEKIKSKQIVFGFTLIICLVVYFLFSYIKARH